MKIVLFKNKKFMGDFNQIEGISAALPEQIERLVLDEDHFSTESITTADLVFASGDHGLSIIEQLKKQSLMAQMIWSGHQYFPALDSLRQSGHLPNIVTLPITAITLKQARTLKKHCHVELTQGVAHCINEDTLTKDCKVLRDMLPYQNNAHYVGIVIAGDVAISPAPIRYYTEAEARKNAMEIVDHLKRHNLVKANTMIFVTNGPRTGQYDPKTGQERQTNPHRGLFKEPISAAFVEVLDQAFPELPIHFYHFRYGDPSAYKPMMQRLAESGNGIWYVPSESSSMVTESAYLAEKNIPVMVYCPSTANETHLSLVGSCRQLGLITRMSEPLAHADRPTRVVNAAKQIAHLLKMRYFNTAAENVLPSHTFYAEARNRSVGSAALYPCDYS